LQWHPELDVSDAAITTAPMAIATTALADREFM
jgi:hypothetical protein